MLDKRLTVPLCDFRSKPLEELSPLKEGTSLFSEQKTNMSDRSCEEEDEEDRRDVKKKIVKIIGIKPEEDLLLEEEDRRDVKKKIVRIIDIKSEKDLLLDEEKSESDEDSESDTGDMSLSAYEKMIEKNRAQRLKILKSLKIDEVKAEFCEAVSAVKKKLQPVKRKYAERENTSPPVLRKSRRLANLGASLDLSEDALFSKALNEAKEMEKVNKVQHKRRQNSAFSNIIKKYREIGMQEQEKKIPPELEFKAALQVEELYENYCKDLDIQNSDAELKFFSYDKSVVKSLTLNESNIAKVTPGRITAVAWHPVPDNLIFAAGDKYGNLGIWKVDSESNPYVFKTHTEGMTNLMFNPLNPNHVVSSSYEGTLRCGDMVKHVFKEVYNVSDTTCCTYFDFLSQTTYLIAQKNGKVVLVDDRAERKQSQKGHTCHDYSVKTVHVHPANKNVFVTAENRGPVRLWDLRKLQKEPVADIQFHKRCTSSAYFSPVTGNSILTTSLDDSLSIFDSTNLTKDIKLKKTMSHNNYTGRWLSIFRATWLPNSEEAFVIGSMNSERRIEVYDKDMKIYHIIKHENLCTITSMNIFHPNRPALGGANSSGKVVIFTTR